MMEFFTNREIATLICGGVWLLIILFLGDNKELLKLTAKTLNSVIELKIMLLLLAVAGYISLEVWLLRYAGLWQKTMSASVIIMFVGLVISIFRSISSDRGEMGNLSHELSRLIKYTIVIEYIVGFKSFPLLIEVMIGFFVSFCQFSYTFTKGKKDCEKSGAVLFSLIILFSIPSLIYSFYFLYKDWDYDILLDFMAAPLLSICFIPCLFILKFVFLYETASAIRRIPKFDKPLFWYAVFKGFKEFKANFEVHHRWHRTLCPDQIKTRDDVDKSIRLIVGRLENENSSYYVVPEKGWPNKIIHDFLWIHDLKQDDLEIINDSSFTQISLDRGKCISKNYIGFLAHSHGGVVTQLRLDFCALDQNVLQEDLAYFELVAKNLFEIALGEKSPFSLTKAILGKSNDFMLVKGKEVRVIVNPCKENDSRAKYKLYFIIRNPDSNDPLPQVS